jgi:hypothetical protein
VSGINELYWVAYVMANYISPGSYIRIGLFGICCPFQTCSLRSSACTDWQAGKTGRDLKFIIDHYDSVNAFIRGRTPNATQFETMVNNVESIESGKLLASASGMTGLDEALDPMAIMFDEPIPPTRARLKVRMVSLHKQAFM